MAGSGSNPFQHLEKSAVLQEACIFNETPISLSRCLLILIYLLNPHMVKKSYDVVKHWVNEGQEAASADNITVQYQALGLLYHLRRNDRLAVTKMLNKFTESFK